MINYCEASATSHVRFTERGRIRCQKVLQQHLDLFEQRLGKFRYTGAWQVQIVIHVMVADRTVRSINKQWSIDVKERCIRHAIQSVRQQSVGSGNSVTHWVGILASRRYTLSQSTHHVQTTDRVLLITCKNFTETQQHQEILSIAISTTILTRCWHPLVIIHVCYCH